MKLTNEILVNAEPRTIYSIAAEVVNWPSILPHFRWVRVLGQAGNRRRVVLAARRGLLPVRWWADQELYPDEPRIAFRHLDGPTRGMTSEWRFSTSADGTRVAVTQDLSLDWPFAGAVAGWLLARLVVDPLSRETLSRIKQLAEAEQADLERLAGESAVGGEDQ